MKVLIVVILLAGLFGNGVKTITRINRYAREAARAYGEQNYDYAIAAYTYLLNELEVEDDQIRLNLAHAHYRALNLDQAAKEYKQLLNHASPHIRALSALQLGNVSMLQKKYKSALSLYRTALIAAPESESARYNYELLKKYLDKHPELVQEEEEEPLLPEDPTLPEPLPVPPAADEMEAPAPKQVPDSQGNKQEQTDTKEQANDGTQTSTGSSQNPDKDNLPPDAPEREQAAGPEAGDSLGQSTNSNTDNGPMQPGSTDNISDQDQRAQTQRGRLQQVNLTPEKAQLLLDAMRNAELQYMQQLPRKATRKPDKTKPDW